MPDQQAGGGGGGVPSGRPRRDELVLRRFLVDGRLVATPAQRGQPLAGLDHLASLGEAPRGGPGEAGPDEPCRSLAAGRPRSTMTRSTPSLRAMAVAAT